MATTRPHSAWKAVGHGGLRPSATGRHISQIGLIFHRARKWAPGMSEGHLDRLVQVLAVDHEVAGQLLLGLGERTVGGQDLAVADADLVVRFGRRAQALAALEDAASSARSLTNSAYPGRHALVAFVGGVDDASRLPASNSMYRMVSLLFFGGSWCPHDDRHRPDRHPTGRISSTHCRAWPPLGSNATRAVPAGKPGPARPTIARAWGAPASPIPSEPAEGDELELLVGAVATGGGCVARGPDGRVIFVRHALPGRARSVALV